MQDKRERILDAAFEQFRQFGFVKTTVQEIASRAQVGKGTIYSYFNSKEEILIALVEREFIRGFATVSAAVERQTDPMAKLETALLETFDYFHSNPLVTKVMAMDQGVALSVISEKNREYQQLSMDGIRAILSRGQKEGVFRVVDLEKTAYTIDCLIRSFHYVSYLGLQKFEPRTMVDSVIDLLTHGLAIR